MNKGNPRRKTVFAALAVLLGVEAGALLPFSPFMAVAALLSLGLLLLLRKKGRPTLGALLALMFCLSLTRASVALHPILPPAGTYAVSGTVSGTAVLRESDHRVAVFLTDVTLQSDDTAAHLDRVYWTYHPAEDEQGSVYVPVDGQKAAFTGKLYIPRGQSNPYGFDFRMYLLQKGAAAGISGGGADVLFTPETQTEPSGLIERTRKWIAAQTALYLGDGAPLADALLLGDKTALDPDTIADFRTAGVAHLLAVSGLHVMVLLGALMFVCRRCRLSLVAGFFVSVTPVLLYALVTGAAAPVLRAVVLMGCMWLGRLRRKKTDGLTSLAAACILILLIRPAELFAAGFQLSFCALLGLILPGDAVRARLRRIKKPLVRKLIDPFASTLCANLGLSLCAVYWFHRLSLVGLVINPLLGTAAAVLLPALLLLLPLSLVPPIAVLYGKVLSPLVTLLQTAVHTAASAPMASVIIPVPPWYVSVTFVLLVLLCTRYLLLKTKLRLLLGGTAAVLCAVMLLLTQSNDVRLLQLSLGDADSTLLMDGGTTVVIDAGEDGGDLTSYLLATARGIDTLILTHLHSDHVMGLEKLLSGGVPIREIILSAEAEHTAYAEEIAALLEEARAHGIPFRTVCYGDVIVQTNRLSVQVVWPRDGMSALTGEPNDTAMALLCDLDGMTYLNMSDVPGTHELYAAQPAMVMKLAHHGAADSTGEALLKAVQPQIALVSGNGLPDETALRLQNAGITTYDNDLTGALELSVHDGVLTLKTFRR